MLKYQPIQLMHWSLLLIASTVTTAVADNANPDFQIECGGQYECVVYAPVSEAEARVSRGHPDFVEREGGQRVTTLARKASCGTSCDVPPE